MFIVSTGMVSAVGLQAEATVAAIRAGISRNAVLRFHDSDGQPVLGAAIDLLPRHGDDELYRRRLAAMAARECLQNGPRMRFSNVALAAAIPPASRYSDPPACISRLESDLGVRFHPHQRKVFSQGRTAGLYALEGARTMLAEPGVEACLVIGVDSLINLRDLEYYDAQRRLKTKSNSDGFVPGEGAVAALVTSLAVTEPRIEVAGLGFGREPSTLLSDEPTRAQGLTQAVRAALEQAGIAMHNVDLRVTDLNGERYFFSEQALVVNRVLRQRKERFPIWYPARSTGELGAATGLSLLVMAWYGMRKVYFPGDIVLLLNSSAGEERAAAVLRLATVRN